jgi:hypothetical protein
MKQHVELGIILAMSALMVFATTAYMTPSANAAVSGGSNTGANGGDGSSDGRGGAGGRGGGDTPSSTSTTTGSSSGSGSSSTAPKTTTTAPKTTTTAPKTTTAKPCVPGKCLGSPGYYTTNGHHHCFDGAPGCACTDPHKCTVGSAFIRPGSIMTTV